MNKLKVVATGNGSFTYGPGPFGLPEQQWRHFQDIGRIVGPTLTLAVGVEAGKNLIKQPQVKLEISKTDECRKGVDHTLKVDEAFQKGLISAEHRQFMEEEAGVTNYIKQKEQQLEASRSIAVPIPQPNPNEKKGFRTKPGSRFASISASAQPTIITAIDPEPKGTREFLQNGKNFLVNMPLPLMFLISLITVAGYRYLKYKSIPSSVPEKLRDLYLTDDFTQTMVLYTGLETKLEEIKTELQKVNSVLATIQIVEKFNKNNLNERQASILLKKLGIPNYEINELLSPKIKS